MKKITPRQFSSLFKPKTIAVFGVSLSNDRHPANVIYNKLLLRYPVKVYPVNPRGGHLRKDRVYPDIASVPAPVDLAVIATRADHVPKIVEECILHKVAGAVIISGGFAEVGRTELQERIVAAAGDAGFPFIGPNCLGIYSPNIFDTFFLPGERLVRPEAGHAGDVAKILHC